jgi:hypothetical protein
MKELAFGRDSIGGIEPEENILEKKSVDESDFFEIPITGARVSLRDAKSVLDLFCKAAAESQGPLPLNNPMNFDPSNAEQNLAAQKKPSKFVKEFEPNYHSKETTSDEHNRKHFLTFLYFPISCGPYVNYTYRVMC